MKETQVRFLKVCNYTRVYTAILSREFAPDGRELSALKPENSPPLAGCFQAGFKNKNCWGV